ncbi:MAG: hypothetical protein A3B91_03075 [Candidatus Yanofskybacteria bacterium RIFCSPHIGHO2_02_FULL_41_29]|uniref:Uncharacterized protein n=1 Tax=Candidatus Yanofskybacteria bacterium RIFCSPHIGHO2_01_FULL_41_53 TaxID=1802663 RepID=A0A1F8EIG8_9BACT|nr:MAG: hypothetical protein A2650_00235 [Candidatus Yanofskybacteria bacterium RIFCSPHIGHO2_01_FULL_41_53]OGN11128.1 MAG: hypothetical protein A3B91_03075 [Candidatus Yanofskybacteria bacterium RIFCSPHIGHO2_02_FULL_41_29]OGN16994.1 MAG: hypothetical protein A3F48_00415 [Candidatus Yanofskybacteria bacterium RIFCSPHIGHO2_12_FULL_41_9]OGN22054.1 MAG: hypothetical protein A2916_00305 [Candidatus Yanofskybacteria bacterium RIFCSPLOWO2_01_FULL_41_67]OGN29339.1 MAG: hypothetical protein A3H54_03190 
MFSRCVLAIFLVVLVALITLLFSYLGGVIFKDSGHPSYAYLITGLGFILGLALAINLWPKRSKENRN